MKFVGLILAAMVMVSAGAPAWAISEGEALRLVPVQDNGRIKPYDTFANETLESVYGKKKFEDRPAWQIVLTWMLAPTAWTNKELFEVRNRDIQKALGLDEKQRWFKGEEVFSKERFPELMQDLRVRRESKEKLTPYFQALQRLENQFFIFREMASGRLLRLLPAPQGDEWLAVADFNGEAQSKFADLTQKFVSFLSTQTGSGSSNEVMEKARSLDESVSTFVTYARSQQLGAVPASTDLALEVHYNDFHPFRWAYVFYLLSAISLLLMWTMARPQFVRLAWLFTATGFLIHTYGFVLRVYLAGRPPVSNMYETVVWVAWGAILFAAILQFTLKNRLILLAGNLVGIVALIVADSAPVVLDPAIQPLEAVLRSNYWLVIHVMTITISYAAFFLAFALGDLGLFYYLKGPEKYREEIRGLVTAIYRAMQIGVAFLAPGIILGGVWADYSWGRFWGWDPKETWALIVLLGYIAVLHGRLTNWIRDFGMVVSAVMTFSLVIMAWYGVNFVLGAGLHSYGFGAGGVEYVSGFVALHFLSVVYVSMLERQRRSAS